MKLYVRYISPYARLARILEKGLENRVEIIEAKTRTPDSRKCAASKRQAADARG